MREFKFRAWNPHQNTMISWDRLHLLPACQFLTSNGYETMQFTGKFDKNNVPIYEGDIVKQTFSSESGRYEEFVSYNGHHIGQVVITTYKGVCMKKPLCYMEENDETNVSNQYKTVASYRCEVIGNIYEHPHLLESKVDA